MKDPDWQEEIGKVAEEIEASGGDLNVVASALPRLWQRIGGMKASEADWQAVTTIALTAAQFMFAPAVKHYGPFCLHPVVITYKDGREETQSYYQVVLGTHPTPFIVPMDAYGVAERGQEIAAFTALGQVPIAQSELQNVVKYLKLRLLNWNASVDYYREWQSTHAERATEREQRIQYAQEQSRVVTEGLRELEAEYGTQLSLLTTDLTPDEAAQEVHDLRLRLSGMDGLTEHFRAPM